MAFKMTRGLYAPRVMSFGPTNAPACMQRFMNHIFQPLRDRYPGHFENYMDDCSVAMLHSDPTPTFSHSAPSVYTPTYATADTWDCITVVSDFPDTVPAHPLDILPCVVPEPVTLRSLMRRRPYTTHRFTEFCPRRTDGDHTELFLTPRGHFTHAHTLEHSTFCREHVCPTHFPYGGNRLAK